MSTRNHVIREAVAEDLPAILAIYNDAVRNTTAIWNDQEADLADRQSWLEARKARGFPVLVLLVADEPVAYASYSDFRSFEGYRQTVENSIYVRSDQRGKGIGHTLLSALLQHARSKGLHVMVAGIEAENIGSIALHRAHGFEVTGRLPEVGFKFGRYLDLVFMTCRL
ncbi:MAG: GNAT family N-acetyltransferase [Rhizobiales bacterium]|nr:GNAT family N-acetyltransferase [Hyphomicrobiales bacterium]